MVPDILISPYLDILRGSGGNDRVALCVTHIHAGTTTGGRSGFYAAMAMGLKRARVSSSWASASFCNAGQVLSLNWVVWMA